MLLSQVLQHISFFPLVLSYIKSIKASKLCNYNTIDHGRRLAKAKRSTTQCSEFLGPKKLIFMYISDINFN